MNIRQVIQEIGLNDKEADVYLELIKSSSPQPASILSKKIELNRTTVYKILLKLAKMGMVSKTMKHSITCFGIDNPERALEDMLIKKQRRIESLSKRLVDILPEIQGMRRQDVIVPNIRHYEGVEGIKRVYEDTLAEDETIYAFENVESMDERIKQYIFEEYVPRRIEKNIHAKVITPKNKENEVFRKEDKVSLRETRFFEKNTFPIEIEINIYGQKTAFFSYKEDELFAVILRSSAIANSMKSIFNLCWQNVK